eukprot:m51a1_g9285 hypothetical protein (610) ;mRNA; f:14148-15977
MLCGPTALLSLVLCAALLPCGGLAGVPKDDSVTVILRSDHPADVVLTKGTSHAEVEIVVAKYALSLAHSAVEVKKWAESEPEESVDAKATQNITVVLEKTSETNASEWVAAGSPRTFHLSDKGLEKFFSVSASSSAASQRLRFSTTSGDSVAVRVHTVCMGGYGKAQAWLGLAVLVVTYSIISFELAERALMGLAAMFVTLLLLLIAHKEYPLETVATWLDQSTFVLLFGMMIVVKIFGDTGFFEWIAVQSIKLSRGSIRVLFVLICTMTACLSAFLDNVTTVLLSAPITIKVCELMERSPVPFLVGQALLSNIGGTATLVGDPPNIIIGSMLKETVTFNDFILNLTPCVIFVSVVCEAFLLWVYRKSVSGRRDLDISVLKNEGQIKEKTKFIKCSVVLSIVLLGFFLSSVIDAEPAWIALAGATALMLLTYPKHIETPLTGVEWNTLVFFGALFVLVHGMEKLGLIRLITDVVGSMIAACSPKNHLLVAVTLILWVSALLSSVISSIPTTTTLIPVIVELAEDPSLHLALKPLIWALSLGACFGGNGTLVGAAANVVVAGIVRAKGYFVTFANFTKVGFPVMALSTAIANVYLIFIYVLLGWGVGPYD